VCCQVEVSATSWSLVQRSLSTVLRRCVWSRNIKNRCSIYDISSLRVNDLTFILLTWRKSWANNASKNQMGFNLELKGLRPKRPTEWPAFVTAVSLDDFWWRANPFQVRLREMAPLWVQSFLLETLSGNAYKYRPGKWSRHPVRLFIQLSSDEHRAHFWRCVTGTWKWWERWNGNVCVRGVAHCSQWFPPTDQTITGLNFCSWNVVTQYLDKSFKQ
jgi:hypothetical protein